MVQLTGGQQLELEPMTLPLERREYRIAGTVFFADGRPAPGAFISMRDSIVHGNRLPGIETGEDGKFSFVVHEGLSYVVAATHWDEAQRQQVAGTAGPLVITGDLADLESDAISNYLPRSVELGCEPLDASMKPAQGYGWIVSQIQNLGDPRGIRASVETGITRRLAGHGSLWTVCVGLWLRHHFRA